MSETKTIAGALAKAQLGMGKALKKATNPHFRKQYADLGNVMDACLEPLNEQEIAVVQPCGKDDHGDYVETIFIHSSGESLSCKVYLLIGKKDMQGLGSAITYARRYGLMSMAGIAPEDDDGNAAAKSPAQNNQPPKKAEQANPNTDENKRDEIKGKIQQTPPNIMRDVWCNNAEFRSEVVNLPAPMRYELRTAAMGVVGGDLPEINPEGGE